ncbi:MULTISPECIES: LysR substrate-binding domain-containing protein [Stenotrophomonas]|uniref:LysR family transcriptional regulator n=1 Tax=Stenotrophomonas maltophilia TaxID=40324 RepID=A0A2W6IFU5_STEMA|nr:MULTISPECIES: LysR substrate-binding domain-containing protein [Stenotrophomonas]PSM14376.1 LysR family transcriptional regulator [Stenotrophomonas maltophilia]PZS93954.1 LysR family transcriptional regulator [Stenotrophomonas maltophilia]
MQDSAKSNRTLFELDLLRALVMVADCGSFTTAATRLHSTQSTVSQKVRRLEELAGHRLLERGHRDVHPTDAGHTLLGYARRMLDLNEEMAQALAGATVETAVRIGVPEDFVNAQTTRMLAAFSRRHPQVKLEISSGLSRDLAHGFDHGELDLVLVKQRRNSRQAVHCRREPMHWIDSLRSSCLLQDPLPLVTFPPRGLYRDEMIHAVEALGLRWRIAFTSSSLSGIQGAVADGIGISLLPRRAVTREHRIIDGERDLPVIDNYEIGLLHRPDADDAVRALASELWRQVQREPD